MKTLFDHKVPSNKWFTTIITSLMLLAGMSTATQAVAQPVGNDKSISVEQLYSSKGYPYKNLIRQADQVKIIYSEEGEQIDCSIEISLASKRWRSEKVTTKRQSFEDQPLASCLARQQAKQWLTLLN